MIIVSVAIIILGYWSGRRVAASAASRFMRDKTRCFRSGLSRSHSEIKKQRLRAISLRRVGYFIAILNFILALMEHRSRMREVSLDIKNLLAHAHNWLPREIV